MKYLLIIIIIISSTNLISQTKATISNDDEFLATLTFIKKTKNDSTAIKVYSKQHNKSYSYRLGVYCLDSMKLIACDTFAINISYKPDTIGISPNNRYLYVKIGYAYLMFKLYTAKYIVTIENTRRYYRGKNLKDYEKRYIKEPFVCFANHDDIIAIAGKGILETYNLLSGRHIEYHSGLSSAFIKDFKFNSTDEYIIVTDVRNQNQIWKSGRKRTKKRISGNKLYFNQDEIIAVRKNYSSNYFYTYNLSSFRRTNRIILNARSIKGNGFKYYADSGRFINHTGISPMGKYLYFIHDQINQYKLNFINVKSGKIKAEYIIEKNDEPTFNIKWLNDSVVAFVTPSNSFICDAYKTFVPGILNHHFPLSIFDLRKNPKVFSNNYSFVADVDRNSFSILPTNYKQGSMPFYFDRKEFLAFSPQSNYIILQNEFNHIQLINTNNLVLKSPGDVVIPKELSNSIIHYTEPVVEDNPIAVNNNESFNNRILNLESINKISKELNPRVSYRGYTTTDTTITVQAFLADTNGTYYYDASLDEWKYIWCKLLYETTTDSIFEVDSFLIYESRNNDTLLSSITLLLDHSGSMGEQRVNVLQKEALDMSRAKKANDEIAIIKFDHKTDLINFFESDSRKIRGKLKVCGLEGFGGGTAMLNAVNSGVGLLQAIDKERGKIVILITDGIDNSSNVSPAQIIRKARQVGVTIYTVGYGDYVNEGLLKGIAKHTGGIYFKLSRTSDLSWILRDIYNKHYNYYNIEFEKPQTDIKQIFLKVCYEKLVVDSLWVNLQDSLPLDSIDFNFEYDPDLLEIVERKRYEEQLINIFEELCFPNINFYFAKTEIIDSTLHNLDFVLNFLNEYPDVSIQITGYTDEVGRDDFNLKLSNARAEKVKQIFIKKGIEEYRLNTLGKGSSQPVIYRGSHTREIKNRRVEFELIF